MKLEFTVLGTPVAQPRQRHRVVKGIVMNYTPKKHPVQAFKQAIGIKAKEVYKGKPLTCPLRLSVLCIFPRVSGMPLRGERIWKDTKPDFDNLAKAICDALNNVIWRDDSQVVSAWVEKFYSDSEEEPRVEIEITTL